MSDIPHMSHVPFTHRVVNKKKLFHSQEQEQREREAAAGGSQPGKSRKLEMEQSGILPQNAAVNKTSPRQ